jgi:hypothetical protein
MIQSVNRRASLFGFTPLLLGAGFTVAAASDALVPGSKFHATGSIPCAVAAGQPMTACPFGVRREGQDSARVTVTLPDGRKRVIHFVEGEVTDVSGIKGSALSSERQGDLTQVRIGEERFEIVDAIVFGG